MRRNTSAISRNCKPARLDLRVLEERLAPASIVWQGGGANNWSTDANWVGGKAPGLMDIAQFNAGSPSVNVDTPQTVAGVEFNNGWGGGVTLSAKLTTTTGPSLWNVGQLNGNGGSWDNSGTVTIGNGVAMNGATINNTGTFVHATGGNLTYFTGAVFNNMVGGTYEFQSDADVFNAGGAAPTFNNSGLIRKTGGLGETVVQGNVNNQGGTWDAQSGTLTLQSNGGPGTHTGGVFKATLGAVLNVTGGHSATWTGTYTGSGTGIVRLQNGNITIGAGGATFNFPGSLFEWNGGSITNGVLTNSGTITLNGGQADFGNGATLDNLGVIDHVTGGNLNYFTNAIINNKATGVYNFKSDGDISNGGGAAPTFNNAGLIRKMSGGGVSAVQGLVNNQGGTWEAQSGTLSVQSNGGIGTHTGGNFQASMGAVVDVSGGNNATWTGTFSGSGAGVVTHSAGTITVGMAGATFNFPGSLFQWNGGAIFGNTLTNAATGIINLNGGAVAFGNGATLNNLGTINHITGSNLDYFTGGVINNEAGGIYNFQSDGDIANVGGAAPTFNNMGLIRKMTGSGTTAVQGIVNNKGGTWEAQSGTLVIQSNGGAGTHTGGTFVAALNSAIDVTGGTNTTWTGTYSGSGAGVVTHSNGTLTVGGGGATFNFPGSLFQWNGGGITGGTLTNASTGIINLNGGTPTLFNGTLANNGTINHLTNNNLDIQSSATLNNNMSGTYDFKSDGDIFDSGGLAPVVNNFGLIRKSSGGGSTFVRGQVNSTSGTWQAQSGTLVLQPTRADGKYLNGTFNVDAGATIDLLGGSGSNTWEGTYSGTGTGTVRMNDGVLITTTNGATFDFTTPGYFLWNGGTITGHTFTNKGFIDLGFGTVGLNGETTILNNVGTIRHLTANNVNYSNKAVIQNTASGVYEFHSDGDIFDNGGTGPRVFNNLGLVRKVGGVGLTSVQGQVNIQGGTWDAQTGTLSIASSGGTHTGGTFQASMGAEIDLLGGGTATWTGTYSGSGSGTVAINSGTLAAAAGGATFNLTTPGLFQWRSGTITGQFVNAGIMDLSSAGVQLTGLATVLTNNGTIRHITGSNLNMDTGATLQNSATGIYDFRSDGDIFNGGGIAPIVNNVGLIRKSVGAGVSAVQGRVNNQGGTWDAQTGTLRIQSDAGGGTHTGGVFNATTGAALDMTGGQGLNTWEGTYTGSGGGVVSLANGTLVVGPAGATFNFPTPGLFQWNGGEIRDGVFTNAGVMDFNGGTPTLSQAATVLNNTGLIRHITGSNLNVHSSALIQNAATGIYEFMSDGDIFNAGGLPSKITNAGVIRKTAGAALSEVQLPFSNTGTVEAKSGTLNFSNSVVQYDSGTLTGGTWFIGAGALNLTAHGGITTNKATVIYSGTGGNFSNFNSIQSNEGNLSVINTGSFAPPGTLTNNNIVTIEAGSTLGGAIDFVQNAGTSTVNGKLDPVGVVNVTGGILTGTGTVVSNTNNSGGTVLSAGTGLTVDGIYTLTGTGLTSVTGLMNVTGLALLQGGTSNVIGKLTANSGIQQSGGTSNVDGTLASTTGITLSGGTLKGNGGVAGQLDNTGGTLAPGSSPGQFTVSGDYTQSGTGKLFLEINGPTAISQFDRLNVVGKVTLGGQLEAALGYPTVTGENFVVLTNDGSDTTSMTFNGIPNGAKAVIGGATFRVDYNLGDGNDVVLTRLATGIESLVVDDGSAQRSRIRDFTIAFGGVVNLPMTKSNAFLLERTGPMGSGTVAINVDDTTLSTPTQTIVRLTLAAGPFNVNNSLTDGFYKLSVFGAQILDQGGLAIDADNNGTVGGNNISTLHRLFGDANGDAAVTAIDFNAFRLSYGTTGPSIFDYDNSNSVTAADFNEFRLRYGFVLMP